MNISEGMNRRPSSGYIEINKELMVKMANCAKEKILKTRETLLDEWADEFLAKLTGESKIERFWNLVTFGGRHIDDRLTSKDYLVSGNFDYESISIFDDLYYMLGKRDCAAEWESETLRIAVEVASCASVESGEVILMGLNSFYRISKVIEDSIGETLI